MLTSSGGMKSRKAKLPTKRGGGDASCAEDWQRQRWEQQAEAKAEAQAQGGAQQEVAGEVSGARKRLKRLSAVSEAERSEYELREERTALHARAEQLDRELGYLEARRAQKQRAAATAARRGRKAAGRSGGGRSGTVDRNAARFEQFLMSMGV